MEVHNVQPVPRAQICEEPPAPTTPPHGEGQEPGETVWQFLERRAAEDARRSETAEQQQARENRAANAAQKAPPGRKSSAKFFLWMTVGEVDYTAPPETHDILIRQSITRAEAITRWEEFGDNQKMYNAYRNEWDICVELGEPRPDEEYEDLAPVPESTMEPGTTMPEAFNGHVALFYNDEDITSYQPNLTSFTHEISWFRFGIIPEVVPTAGVNYDKLHKGQVLRYFGQLEDDTVPVMLVKAACGYMLALVELPASEAPFLPGVISDMNMASNRWIRVGARYSPLLACYSPHTPWQHAFQDQVQERQDGLDDCHRCSQCPGTGLPAQHQVMHGSCQIPHTMRDEICYAAT